MEKNRICKICNRRFSNGKAMGGHMRSHLSKLPLPPKPHNQHLHQLHYPIPLRSSPNSISSSSSHNPSQSYRSLNHELIYMSKPDLDLAHDGPVHGDCYGESETESPRCTTRRRSKRRRKSAEKVAESAVKVTETSSPEQVSSISDEIINDEDVALCLLMLSKGTKVGDVSYQIEEETEEDEDEPFDEIPFRSKSKGRYKCETCKKIFRSYQALGGHKANHKKISKEDDYEGGSGIASCGGGAGGSDHRIYKCPFCDKVFDSGQALGGHKKVHFSYLGNNASKTLPPKSKSGDKLLDLNLPAPEEIDDEDEELELSQVYLQRNP